MRDGAADRHLAQFRCHYISGQYANRHLYGEKTVRPGSDDGPTGHGTTTQAF